MKKLNKKGIAHIGIILGIVIALLIIVIGGLVYDRNQDDDSQTNTQESTTTQETPEVVVESTNTFTEPQGYKEYTEEQSISFQYPASWDDWEYGGFQVSVTPNGESFVAPYGGGGAGGRHIFDTETNMWLRTGDASENIDNAKEDKNLTAAESNQSEFPVAYGQTGEGGGISHYILITDGVNSFQIVFPGISEERDKNPQAKLQEQKDAISTIIESIRFN